MDIWPFFCRLQSTLKNFCNIHWVAGLAKAAEIFFFLPYNGFITYVRCHFLTDICKVFFIYADVIENSKTIVFLFPHRETETWVPLVMLMPGPRAAKRCELEFHPSLLIKAVRCSRFDVIIEIPVILLLSRGIRPLLLPLLWLHPALFPDHPGIDPHQVLFERSPPLIAQTMRKWLSQVARWLSVSRGVSQYFSAAPVSVGLVGAKRYATET